MLDNEEIIGNEELGEQEQQVETDEQIQTDEAGSEQQEVENEETPLETEAPEELVEQPEPTTVPVHVVEKLREDRRQADLDKARLEGELNVYKQKEVAVAAVQQKSPMELVAEEQGIDTTQAGWQREIVLDGELYGKQAAWDKANEVKETIRQSLLTTAKNNPDFQSVINQGEDYLTIRDRKELDQCTSNYGQRAYELCKKALERSGIVAAPVKKTVVLKKPQLKEKPRQENKTVVQPKEKPTPTQDEILSGVPAGVQRAMTY